MPESFQPAHLYKADIDLALLQRLFSDLEQYAQISSIQAKSQPGAYATTASLTPSEALHVLQAGTVRGIQIAYRYENENWLDTILAVSNGWNLVRIRI